MEALADQEEVTQRELSQQTGLNLKKVNYCLHKLLEKGHVKFQRALNNQDRRAYLYILTPAGMKEKSRLTYRFLKFTLSYYNRVEEKLETCLKQMEHAGVEKVVLSGASDAARIVLGLVIGNGIEIVAIVDDTLADAQFAGVQVIKAEQLTQLDWDGLLITSLEDLDGEDQRLRRMGLPENKIWRLS